MKKLLVLFMSLMMVCSLAACGGDDADTAGTSDVQNETNVSTGGDTQVVEEETANDVYYLAVGDFLALEPLDMVDLSGTTWSLAGGTTDGAEITQEELLATLEMYGGQNDIVFGADGTSVQLVQGGGAAEGTCTYVEGAKGVQLVFDFDGTTMEYIALLTEVEGVSVLMLMPDEASALYYVLIG